MRPAPRLVYWDNIPAPYVVERFNTLARRGTLDFHAWFARRHDADRSWDVDESTWHFRGTYVGDPSSSLATAHQFRRRCDDVRPDLAISLYGERPFVAGHAILKARGIRTAFRILPTFDSWIRRTRTKETLKHLLFRSADAAKVPGPDGLAYAVRYGMTADRVRFVTQSVDVTRFAGSDATQRHALRARLGAQDKCLLLYVGRRWHGKGVLVLLAAYQRARLLNPAMSLLFVGDGADADALRRSAAGFDDSIIEPFAQTAALPQYYAAADVFVFPTLGDPHGLVVEEAQAAGLPVIATDAAGDIARRVGPATSGYIVPAGDSDALATRLVEMSKD